MNIPKQSVQQKTENNAEPKKTDDIKNSGVP